jgi:hypothetical protein
MSASSSSPSSRQLQKGQKKENKLANDQRREGIATLKNAGVHVLMTSEQWASESNENKISWNNFEGWAAGTGFFELYRVKKDSAGIDIKDLIATVVPPTKTFTDIDLTPPGIDNATYYYMKTTEDVNDPFNVQSVSLSNRAYVYKEIKIIAPEVFTPNGLTPVFRPRVLTTNNNKFSLKVYNRWGKLVFS